MQALFIGSDPSIFRPDSAARARLRTYASAIGTLHVLSRATGPAVAEYRDGVQEGSLFLHAVGGGKLSSLSAMRRRAHTLIVERGIEVISAQDPFEHGLIALQAVRGTQAKLHLQVHTDFCSPWFTKSGIMRAARVRVPLLNRVRIMLADRVIPHAQGVRVVSERVKASLIARYGNRLPPVTVIPIATTVTLPERVPLPPHSFSFVIMTVSRLEPEKRLEDAIDAFARMARQYPSAGLVIVGEGSERRRLEKRARRLGLDGRVLFLGWRDDALALLQSAQVYLHTSAYEGYGLSLVEAALARVPIVTTDVGIVGEVLKGYEDALVAPVADPAALAVHIVGLIEDAQARMLLVLKAEETVRAHLASLTDQPAQIAADLRSLA